MQQLWDFFEGPKSIIALRNPDLSVSFTVTQQWSKGATTHHGSEGRGARGGNFAPREGAKLLSDLPLASLVWGSFDRSLQPPQSQRAKNALGLKDSARVFTRPRISSCWQQLVASLLLDEEQTFWTGVPRQENCSLWSGAARKGYFFADNSTVPLAQIFRANRD